MSKKQQMPCCICGELCSLENLKCHERNCLRKVQHRRTTFYDRDLLPDFSEVESKSSLLSYRPPPYGPPSPASYTRERLLTPIKIYGDGNVKVLQTKNIHSENVCPANSENCFPFQTANQKGGLMNNDSSLFESIFKISDPQEITNFFQEQRPCVISSPDNLKGNGLADKNIVVLSSNSEGLLKESKLKTKKIPGKNDDHLILCDICGHNFPSYEMVNHYTHCLRSLSNKYNELSQKATVLNIHSAPHSLMNQKFTRSGLKPNKKKAKKSAVPEMCFCYICGNQYTTASLPIHEKQCLAKWKLVNSRLPKYLKRLLPRKPQILVKNKVTHLTRQEIMDIQWRASLENRIKCPYCQKCFSPFKIERHEAICKKVRRQNPFIHNEHRQKIQTKRNLFSKYSLVRPSQMPRSKTPKMRLLRRVSSSKKENSCIPRLTKSNEYLKVFFRDKFNKKRTINEHVTFQETVNTDEQVSVEKKVLEWQMKSNPGLSTPHDQDIEWADEDDRKTKEGFNIWMNKENLALDNMQDPTQVPWPSIFEKSRCNLASTKKLNDENTVENFSWNIFNW